METCSTSFFSRKRKQQSFSSITSSLFSFFSRSKSRRSDIALTSSADDEDSSRHTPELLCSRRVFSPDQWNSEEELRNSIPDSSCGRRQIVQKQQTESTSLLKGSSEFYYNADDCSSGMLNPLDDEENVQTTPEAVFDSVEAAGNASQVADPIIPVDPEAKYKQGLLNPQFRGRLVKSPVSFSYRRLLPYMMDIAEDDSGATTTIACEKQPKTQACTIQKVPEDVICCNGDNPTANDSSKESASTVGHVNGGSSSSSSSSSNESQRNLSTPIVINHNCGTESKGQELKNDEVDGKIDQSSCHKKAAAENKPVGQDLQVLHPLNKFVEEISKPCQREEEFHGTKEAVALSQINNSEVLGGVSIAQGNNSLLQSSILHNNADFVTSTGSMKSKDESPPPMNKKVLLNPCSRLKLSKSINKSFSYKRMLPYLMEIANDNCGAATKLPIQTEEVKKSQQQHSPPQQFKMPATTFILSSSDSILLKDENNISPVTSSTSVETLQSLVLESAVSTTTTSSTRSRDDKLKPSYKNEKEVNLISPIEQLLIGGSPETTEVDRLVLVQDEESPPKSERESSRDGQIGPTTRGILKRKNPTGCRGLCPCLSCSSFRLNAERAFEFSRNQMKDSEEVTLSLMKEVSHLRNVLLKLNTTTCKVTSSDQVEEVCVRASEVEEAAKDRLCQMNEDLNVHCRLKGNPQPHIPLASRGLGSCSAS